MGKFLEFYVFNRVWISLGLITGGVVWGLSDNWTFAWIILALGIIMILAHFLLGPIRLIQKSVESGDIAKAQ
jgi:hypothetical protein